MGSFLLADGQRLPPGGQESAHFEADQMEREQLEKKESSKAFFSSGCAVLDCVLGGGYANGRIINIVGDKSTGKTLLAIEAAANYAQQWPDAQIIYNEVEAAFDMAFAIQIGLPVNRVSFPTDCFTVEDVFEELGCVLKNRRRSLYILDSLDALSDRAELKRGMDEGSYGVAKAKQMSQLFRRLVQKLSEAQVTIIIISQVRDNIGVLFGKKYTRSGGRALDFYASQVLFLSQKRILKREIKKVGRPVGIQVHARCEKNKVGLPFRACEFPILFTFGIDDALASLDWLNEVGELEAAGFASGGEAASARRRLVRANKLDYDAQRECLAEVVKHQWATIERDFAVSRRKYK